MILYESHVPCSKIDVVLPLCSAHEYEMNRTVQRDRTECLEARAEAVLQRAKAMGVPLGSRARDVVRRVHADSN